MWLIPDEHDLQIGVGLCSRHCSVDVYAGSIVSAHRVKRDPHELLVLDFDESATMVVAAVRTDDVRRTCGTALLAVLQLHRLDSLVASPLPRTHLGVTPLGDGHVENL